MYETNLLQVAIPSKLYTKFKIALLKDGTTTRAAIIELIELYLKEPKLKKDENK